MNVPMDDNLNPSLRLNRRMKEGLVKKEIDEIDGVMLMPDIPASRIIEFRDKMVIRPDDVFVCTYPKCGTTWMQQIVKLMANNGVETGVDHDIFVKWIDHMFLEEAEAMSSPRHFKTHLPYQLMPGGGDPANATGKYIYVMRNPKDVAVSSYMFFNRISPFPLEWNVEFDKYCKGQVVYGAFYSHFLSWWNHKDADNIFITTYEEMKKDLKTVLSRLATFLGYQLSADTIHSIAEQTEFDAMKINPAANKASTFNNLRKGIVGDWKNVLTVEESARIDEIVHEKISGKGLQFHYGH